MKNERLTPELIKGAAKQYGNSYDNFSESGKIIAAGNFHEGAIWALSQVEKQTKQLIEERQNIVESLFSIRDMVHGTPWAVVNKLIDQLNQQNEG